MLWFGLTEYLMLVRSGETPIILTSHMHRRSIVVLAISCVAVAVSAKTLTLGGIRLLIVPISAKAFLNSSPLYVT